jgi:hypothetical protein
MRTHTRKIAAGRAIHLLLIAGGQDRNVEGTVWKRVREEFLVLLFRIDWHACAAGWGVGIAAEIYITALWSGAERANAVC